MIPENELGVIVLFAGQAKEAGFEIIKMQAGFPDALIKYNGTVYRAEFEYKLSNFKAHCHDIRECDLIICWRRDIQDKFILPVIVLSEQGWRQIDMTLPLDSERDAIYRKGVPVYTSDGDKLLSIRETARTLQVTDSQIRRWALDGRFVGIQKDGGNRWRIPASAVEAFQAGRRGRGKPRKVNQ